MYRKWKVSKDKTLALDDRNKNVKDGEKWRNEARGGLTVTEE